MLLCQIAALQVRPFACAYSLGGASEAAQGVPVLPYCSLNLIKIMQQLIKYLCTEWILYPLSSHFNPSPLTPDTD